MHVNVNELWKSRRRKWPHALIEVYFVCVCVCVCGGVKTCRYIAGPVRVSFISQRVRCECWKFSSSKVLRVQINWFWDAGIRKTFIHKSLLSIQWEHLQFAIVGCRFFGSCINSGVELFQHFTTSNLVLSNINTLPLYVTFSRMRVQHCSSHTVLRHICAFSASSCIEYRSVINIPVITQHIDSQKNYS